MASQYFTVSKIVGEAADATKNLLLTWQQARRVDNSYEWGPEQWPPPIRNKIDAVAEELRRHLHEPPVVFGVELIDHWSSSLHFIFPMPLLFGNRYEVCIVDAPLPGEMKRQIRDRERNGHNAEDRLLAKVLREADEAWGTLVGSSILIILRRVVGGLVTDDNMDACMNFTPDWIRTAE